jgi:hypothetical protein
LRPRRRQAILGREVRVDSEQMQATLARNDLYLQRFVEAFDPGVEVALLILPQVTLDASEFETFATRVASRAAQDLRDHGQRLAFHIVAFHPHLPFRGDDAHRLIGLLRRSPDPTLQLVRTRVLDDLRNHAEPVRYVAAEDVASLDLASLSQPPSLSDRIAEANLRTWRQHGEAMAVVLAGLRA